MFFFFLFFRIVQIIRKDRNIDRSSLNDESSYEMRSVKQKKKISKESGNEAFQLKISLKVIRRFQAIFFIIYNLRGYTFGFPKKERGEGREEKEFVDCERENVRWNFSGNGDRVPYRVGRGRNPSSYPFFFSSSTPPRFAVASRKSII